MAEIFANNEKKRIRLDGTVCMFRGVPCVVYARDYEPRNPLGVDEVFVQPLGVQLPVDGWVEPIIKGYNFYRVKYTTDEFNYSSPELGYIQLSKEALYLIRYPTRTYQAGISAHNSGPLDNKTHHRDWWGTAELASCILGKHMPLSDAIKAVLSDNYKSASFHRHFALQKVDRKRCSLVHRGTVIGIMSPVSQSFRLFHNKGYRAIKSDLDSLGVIHTMENEP